MEFLILLLMGGLAAAAGLWASKGDKKADSYEPPVGTPGGPKSSPDLPETLTGPVPKHGKRASDPVILGKDSAEDAQAEIAIPAKKDKIPHKQEPEKSKRKKNKTGGPLTLPYSTDDIISRSSPYALHRRTLNNAEALAKKDQLDEAIELYERVKKKVDDEEIRRKIDENIQSINDHAEGIAGKEDEIEGPEYLKPAAAQTLALQQLAEGLKSISEGLIKQIDHAFLVQHVISQGNPVNIPESQLSSAGSKEGAQQAHPAEKVQSPAGGGFGSIPMPPITGEMTPLSHGWSGPGMAKGGIFPSGLTINEKGDVVTRGWSDEDFEREWEKFKNLPLKDRRSGEERRRPDGEDFGERDRRFEKDRRKHDLFKERDEFLKRLEEHKRNKKLYEELTKFKEIPETPEESLVAVATPSVSFEKLQENEILLQVTSVRSDQFGPLETESEDELKSDDLRPRPVPYDDPGLPDPIDFLPAQSIADFHEIPEEDYSGPLSFSAAEVKMDHALDEIEIPPKPQETAVDLPDPMDIEDTPDLSSPPAEPEKEKPDIPEETTVPSQPRSEIPPPVQDFPEALSEEPRPIEIRPTIYDLEAIGLPDPLDTPEPEPTPDRGVPEGWPEAPVSSESSLGATNEEEEGGFPELAPLEEHEEQKPQIQEIRGVLELKPPEEEDAPYLALTYDFSKIPDSFKLSKDYHTMEYAYYKYKPMLIKAQEFTRRKMLKNALNYYRVIKSQNIPPEFKRMINRNIQDITEYLEKYLMSR